ncbi:MAG: type III pantothenate kinase [Erysipelotrichaceae bacterium]|nr:type III pantothenate kinase [Erysipelotrichaceae bacterium]
MLLTVDLGNTSTKLGLFEGDNQIAFLCADGVSDNFRSLILSFLYKSNLREDQIEKAILSCVVPRVYNDVYDALASIVGEKNIVDINPSRNYGIKLAMPNPQETGDDLIVMCSYAYNLYRRELLIVSMGTATVLCHVNRKGEFRHCIIAPGFSKIAETLWKNAAQLPEFELKHVNTYLADNTIDAMNVGIYNGYLGMLKSLIDGMRREIGEDLYIIGCGGFGKMVVPYLRCFNEYDPDFVTKGLNYICQRYQ